ncbi:MAG: DUF6323 family protein [Gemmiger sp.]|nr:DUF6323 family protein [Gemmiger sp.]
MKEDFSLLPSGAQGLLAGDAAGLLARCNAQTAGQGLALTPTALAALAQGHADALQQAGRVELGPGILEGLVAAFCDSPYLDARQYASTLGELQALFYALKAVCREQLGDEALLLAMRRLYDATGGTPDYLAGCGPDTLRDAARGILPEELRHHANATAAADSSTAPPEGEAIAAALAQSSGDPALQAGFLGLLARQAARYTAQQSSSLPVEQAQALLASVSYTLENGTGQADLFAPGAGAAPCVWDAAFAKGQHRLEQKRRFARLLWRQACRYRSNTPLENRALTDTLASIGQGLRAYQKTLLFAAQTFPAEIDYPLCLPVEDAPAGPLGIDYATAWLRQLLVEEELLAAFSPADIEALLRGYCPDYRGQLINLYLPVATNALGRVLAGLAPAGLDIPPAARATLWERLATLDAEGCRHTLAPAARSLARQLSLSAAGAACLARTAAGLAPRISAANPATRLRGIFLELGEKAYLL